MSTRAPRYRCRKAWSGVTRDERRNAGQQLEIPCSFDSTDPSAFVEHMKTVHGGGMKFRVPRLPKRLWTGPKPTENGRPFAPTGLEPGAAVTWHQLVPTGETYFDNELGRTCHVQEWIERSGQAWSRGPYGGAWVVPDDEISDEAEIAVLVREVAGRLEAHQTFRATAARAAA